MNLRDCRTALSMDDVLIDDSETIRINTFPSDPSPDPFIEPSFSSDLITLCRLFKTILRMDNSLQTNRIPNPRQPTQEILPTWTDLLEAICSETETFSDTSFLSKPMFVPSLSRLEEKYRRRVRPFDGRTYSDTLPILPSNLSIFPHSTPKSLPSSLSVHSTYKEATRMLQILHSFLPVVHPDPNELFDSSMFDKPDLELIEWLERCRQVSAQNKAPQTRIVDVQFFVHRAVATLKKPNEHLRSLSLAIITPLLSSIDLFTIILTYWPSLRNAFRDGTKEEQKLSVDLMARWVTRPHHSSEDTQVTRFPFFQIDWEGMTNTPFMDELWEDLLAFFAAVIAKGNKALFTINILKRTIHNIETKHHLLQLAADRIQSADEKEAQRLLKSCLSYSLFVSVHLSLAIPPNLITSSLPNRSFSTMPSPVVHPTNRSRAYLLRCLSSFTRYSFGAAL
ncbi:hypothetical protein BLNAU_11069 [Blattamonas nauphoetae]|uniref:Uncharacterized protein n=1 Tax=Blattamonas nauphoetae TaxID=2049346 RepID=A0ABQ9XSG5_9EUKA|nr:hypothetical protein BLNAU_11069 [Blattamonas nauphoetae]